MPVYFGLSISMSERCSVCLSVSVCPSAYLPSCLFVFVCLPLSISLSLLTCLPVYLCLSVSVSVSASLPLSLSLSQTHKLSLCLCLSVCLSLPACLPTSLSLSLSAGPQSACIARHGESVLNHTNKKRRINNNFQGTIREQARIQQ